MRKCSLASRSCRTATTAPRSRRTRERDRARPRDESPRPAGRGPEDAMDSLLRPALAPKFEARRRGRDYACDVLATLVEMEFLRDTDEVMTPKQPTKQRSYWWRVFEVVPVVRALTSYQGAYPSTQDPPLGLQVLCVDGCPVKDSQRGARSRKRGQFSGSSCTQDLHKPEPRPPREHDAAPPS